MMARVTIRGLSLSLLALLALSVAGCAEQPEQAPTVVHSEAVGEVVNELDIVAPGSDGDRDKGGAGGLPREGNKSLGLPDTEKGSESFPGCDRMEPDPVPWQPRYEVANEG